MNRRPTLGKRIALLLISIVLLPAGGGADWLVTQEGARVETKGAWKVKGALVIFTTPSGTLSSMRRSEVDLDRSAEATYEAKNPPPKADEQEKNEKEKKPKKKSVLTLTDADIKRATPAQSDDEPGNDPATPRSGTTVEGVTINEPFGVLNWTVEPFGEGVQVHGTLLYQSGDEAQERLEGLNMILRLINNDGVPFAETNASLTSLSLRVGASTSFSAVFPEIASPQYSFEVEVESRESEGEGESESE